MQHNGIVDKMAGALVGFAVGDALGATVEFMTPEEIKAEYGVHRDIIGGGWLELEPGAVTDDTEMMLCVARSLVECGGYNARDMVGRVVEWYNTDPVDMGHTVRSGLHRYIRTRELDRPASENQAGNGALMRILPFAFLSCDTYDMLYHAHLTHNNKESDDACIQYLRMVQRVLHDWTKAGILDHATEDDLAYNGKSGGYVVDTMNTVLHCFSTTDTFEGALVKCVNLGGDADTNAAILGGLAGAYYGYKAIPERWLQALDKEVHDEFDQLARRFAAT